MPFRCDRNLTLLPISSWWQHKSYKFVFLCCFIDHPDTVYKITFPWTHKFICKAGKSGCVSMHVCACGSVRKICFAWSIIYWNGFQWPISNLILNECCRFPETKTRFFIASTTVFMQSRSCRGFAFQQNFIRRWKKWGSVPTKTPCINLIFNDSNTLNKYSIKSLE